MSETREGDGWWWPCLKVVLLGGPLLITAISAQVYKSRSSANRPAESDTCVLGTTDAAAFRRLISGLEVSHQTGAGNCGRADNPGQCFSALLQRRIHSLAERTGPGMEARITAMHALMRANKAVLLSQSSVPMNPVAVSMSLGIVARGGAPLATPRAERFVYAVDARELGLPGPALFFGEGSRGSRNTFGEIDRSQTAFPTGSYALAAVTIVLGDPALQYPRDLDAGAVEESISYVAAAWTHRAGDEGRGRSSRPGVQGDSVHSMTSLCPRRPAWLDQPAQPVLGGGFNPDAIQERSRRALDAIPRP